MTASDLSDEFDCWKVGLRRCECGSATVMAYEPGCTFIRCLAERKTVAAVPDFNPKQLHDQWNGALVDDRPKKVVDSGSASIKREE